ncbi:DinB family protein [Paenibacillus alba]|uniref:DinB family protein n=1 Tax=Paenibacillus alba TaxID=1197127 RepID=UPI0015641E9A|nr:DinB family protein [Paenibacillus alba]NQX70914.1 DinB family protein [Paenibacillus alba]
MDPNKAKLLLRVDQVEASLAFYTGKLGWEVIERAASGHAVLLQVGKDYRAVLINRSQTAAQQEMDSEESCIAEWLQPKPICPQAGDLVYIGVNSVQEVERSLLERGLAQLHKEEDPGHIRKLLVPSVDGYMLVYWEELYAADEEIIAMYAEGIEALDEVVASLTDVQLNLREVPEKWSIREHVLHLIDLELVTIHKVKFALAESGRTYAGNSFSQDDWSQGLQYANRPIHVEVRMFVALRQHILSLCDYLPDALQRTIITKDREESVGKLLKMMAGHAMHHIRAVRRIRERHET